MLKILHPPQHIKERKYIYQVMFGDWLGLEYVSAIHPYKTTRIELTSPQVESSVTIRDVFLQCPEDAWLTQQSLPEEKFDHWIPPVGIKTVGDPLPVIFGEKLTNGQYLAIHDGRIEIGIDIFGSSFFMLSRYEELVKTARDRFDRFPARESAAYAGEFLNRPIVNEYLEVLWWALSRSFPLLDRKRRTYNLHLTHDVDIPFSIVDKTPGRLLRSMGGAIIHSNFKTDGMKAASKMAKAWLGSYELDPNNCFDFMMDSAEKVGQVSTFNFICGRSHREFDPTYNINSRPIRKLIAHIRDRGHLIGFHGSFNSYKSAAMIKKEHAALARVAEKENVQQAVWGGRQHYLRWSGPLTWRIWNETGFSYDSTLGFAERAGFRCGTCYEYRVFDLQRRTVLNLVEIPLLVMDITLWSPQYMGLSPDKAFDIVGKIIQMCRSFNGKFTLLWHNNQLLNNVHRGLFLEILSLATMDNR
jgi:hypothetical protein